MTMEPKIYLFEYDIPLTQTNLLNYCPGIWFWTITPGTVVVTDDNGNTGYYDTTNAIDYNIKSARQDELDLIPVNSIADCFVTDASFFYDRITTRIYFHFKDFEPPLSKKITIGLPVGYSQNCFDIKPYFYNIYYPPRIEKIGDIKKSMDRLFFGVLKYTTGKVTLLNGDGYFDSFGSWNLYGQPCRILQGDAATAYLDYTVVVSGFISDYSYDWDTIDIEIEDVRKGLTQPVARNLLTTTEYPYLDSALTNKPKPVIFGVVYGIKVMCINTNEVTPTNYEFLICDDEFFDDDYYITDIYTVRVNRGETNEKVVTSYTHSGNILSIPASTVVGTSTIKEYLDNVTIDAVEMSIINGVDIIKYLMLYYEGKPYISTFWDTTETTAARATARDTGIFIDQSDKKLIDILKTVCSDIDARFFCKWNGLYTVRLYDNDRTPIKQIYDSKWVNKPSIQNNSSEYLSSVVIKYGHDWDKDVYNYQYEYTGVLKESAHNTYKKYKNDSFETNLINMDSAEEKALTIMQQSYKIGDIVNRTMTANDGTTDYASTLEITDFIIAQPKKRSTNTQFGDMSFQYLNETLEVYELMGIIKNTEKNELKLSMRYVKDYEEA